METKNKVLVGAVAGLLAVTAVPTLATAAETADKGVITAEETRKPGFFERLFGGKKADAHKDKCKSKDGCPSKKDKCGCKDGCDAKN